MTVRQASGTIFLEGACPVDEAETLLTALLAAPDAEIDWQGSTQLHTALVQLIIARKSRVRGTCGDPRLRPWVTGLVRQ